MKKIMLALLAIALITAFAACGDVVNDSSRSGILNMNGATEEEYYQTQKADAEEFDAENGTSYAAEVSPVIYYDDLVSATLGLTRGDVKDLHLPMVVADYLIAQNPGMYEKKATSVAGVLYYAMAVAEDNDQLLEELNNAISALRKDGTLDALEEQYLAADAQPVPVELPVFENAPTYRVLVTGDLPPMDYLTVDGEPAGYNVALLSALAQQMQCNFETVSATAGSRAMMLTSGKADIVFWVQGYAITTFGMPVNYSDDLPDGYVATREYTEQMQVKLVMAQ